MTDRQVVASIAVIAILALGACKSEVSQPPQPPENLVAYDLERDRLLERDAEVFNELQNAEPILEP